ncbi:AEC family transporter [Streptomyces sp. NBC_01221]|uniref:AEC family transporter n=1 Tax=unclassified Streptomyces TaxID=2593676 RepID=UPI00225AE1DA|nr:MULTISPECIES: AEC family transporter [unclassified Streptomyces]MCX4786418.1 AEC family transporter [Streptomyces sp. NBC_01221]MCX4797728.1 AEC family transporter [Streptomyces sp. NBC_01242]WSJ39013.1 AEC family transporter [Streptomyces sp. NBC_01321]
MAGMHALLSAFAPIWILTAIGYTVGRSGLLGEQAEAVLGRFVFHVAMPAALFSMVSGARLDAFANSSMVAFAAGTALVCGLGFVVSGRLFGRGTADRAIGGMASGYVNSANLGIPVAVQVLGDASFVAQIILFQVLLVSPVILTLLDTGAGAGAGPGAGSGKGLVFRRMLTMPVRNPVIMASLLGVVVSALGLRLPHALAHSCDVLGAAAVPTALITLGLSLNVRPATGVPATQRAEPCSERAEPDGAGVRTKRAEVVVAVALKTLVQPLIAFAVGGPLLGLPDHQLLAVVLCSTLPTAQNAFIYAQQYGLDTRLARDSVVASTVVSMATLSLATWALGASS